MLIAAAFLWAPVQADAYIYWSNDSPSGIARAELNGIGLNNDFLGGSAPAGVAVDSQHIYWANTATNSIGRAELNGANVNQAFIQFTNGIGLGGVAVDAGHIYWTEAMGGSAGAGAIGRANLDGSSPTTSFITGLNNPAGVAVTSSRIYWSDNNGNSSSIGDATFSGGGVTAITNNFVTTGSGTIALPAGLAVDGNFLYWANHEPAGAGSIGRIGLTGAGPTEIVTALSSPAAVAVDGAHLYWTSTSDNAIGRANLDGSSPAPNFITGAKQPNGLAVDGLATPPSTALALSPTSPNGQHGWYTGPVQVQASGTVGGWPIEQTRCVVDPSAVPATFSDLPASSCGAVASDGLHAAFAATRDTQSATSAVISASFKIDSSPPILTCEKAPSFLLGAAGATVKAAVADHESGPLAATASALVTTSSPGNKTVTLSATDLAGNTATAQCHYTITVNRLKPTPKLTAHFHTNHGATTVTSMRISSVPGQAKVTVKCSGKGCPFTSLTAVVKKGKHATTDLASLFHGHTLHAGVKVTVIVTQPHKTGLKWVFTTHAGKKPSTRTTGFQIP